MKEGNKEVMKWLEDTSCFNCLRLKSQIIPNEKGMKKTVII